MSASQNPTYVGLSFDRYVSYVKPLDIERDRENPFTEAPKHTFRSSDFSYRTKTVKSHFWCAGHAPAGHPPDGRGPGATEDLPVHPERNRGRPATGKGLRPERRGALRPPPPFRARMLPLPSSPRRCRQARELYSVDYTLRLLVLFTPLFTGPKTPPPGTSGPLAAGPARDGMTGTTGARLPAG
ncbi:hypothetical protein GCM10017673_52580 [Streptosporangium violaceochromogenes]|nr:hypothetical protein GCM10017673_52580 [Streptosporangium violaceochromogenes]